MFQLFLCHLLAEIHKGLCTTDISKNTRSCVYGYCNILGCQDIECEFNYKAAGNKICTQYMYRPVLWKTVCCNINENLPDPVNGRLFYRGVSPLWCKLQAFFCVVQRCSNISLMGSLEEIMLNLQLYEKIYLFYDGVCVVMLFIF